MWKKVILGLVLVTFVGLQLVHSLTCYSCNTPQSCRNPSREECTDYTANKTSSWLSTIHSDVPQISHSNKFRCMNLTYALNSNNVITNEFLGCYHPAIDVCELRLNISYSVFRRYCRTCDYNLCNRNPAGTFSKSTYTIVASVMALLLTKFWA
ncbi:uncharacterized protein LOC117780989 [Drosophila innubila]|uniref:uncharacterized protein LOC117780989 n=1 Tax=Drosophila innubila TaxID=198719 RepID=UPI00148BEBD1|nr:uncharacterized protein LOC117780989 [Drosophila innubila]XP_034473585.1 uncharacterized protein LOC117780989 [Drosophila innubila]XP_034473586.1 uncharacterized protein LOC117780989 [Drosophila innubila]